MAMDIVITVLTWLGGEKSKSTPAETAAQSVSAAQPAVEVSPPNISCAAASRLLEWLMENCSLGESRPLFKSTLQIIRVS